MTSIEHFSGYHLDKNSITDLDETIENTMNYKVWNCPTLYVLKVKEALLAREDYPEIFSYSHNPQLKYIKPKLLKFWEGVPGRRSYYNESKELLNALNRKGARIVSGTDQFNPYILPGFSLHDELKIMSECGLTPYEVLLTTTVNPSQMLGIENRVGTIEVGKEADLVFLGKNPLENIENTSSVSGVMTNGFWIDKGYIDEMLLDIVYK